MTTAIEDLKCQAKRLRTALSETGRQITHSQALEAIARQRGYRDWNTAFAAMGNQPPGPPVALGDHVTGAYLGHPIAAEVIGVRLLSDGRFRVKLELDHPVNVSAFPAMEVLRRRLNANIARDGATVEKTSSGEPQLRLNL
ncbi:MAG: glyoxalase superfamily protein [Pseudomonadota bacterium]